MSSYESILIEAHERIGLVRLNRPKALNALNSTLMKEIMDALSDFDADESIGAMVITGDERAFAAGADVKEMAEASAVDMLRHEHIESLDRITQIKKPVIAAVSGWAWAEAMSWPCPAT